MPKATNGKSTGKKTKRPPTAYNLFISEQMPILREAEPDLDGPQRRVRLNEMWKTSEDNPNRENPKKKKSSKK